MPLYYDVHLRCLHADSITEVLAVQIPELLPRLHHHNTKIQPDYFTLHLAGITVLSSSLFSYLFSNPFSCQALKLLLIVIVK